MADSLMKKNKKNEAGGEKTFQGKNFLKKLGLSSNPTIPARKDIPALLTDAGVYSYATIISLALHELFDNQWDRKFSLQCLSTLIKHLNLPKQIEKVMIVSYNGEAIQDIEDYINLLLSDPGISGKPVLIIEDLLYLAVREGKYDARMRVLIRYLSNRLNIPLEVVDLCEVSVVGFLKECTRKLNEAEEKEKETKLWHKKMSRYAMISLSAIGGGIALGLTGGLAAPLMAAGVGTILGAGSAAALASTAGAAVIGSLFGVAGAGLTGFKMQKRVGEVEEFAFEVLTRDSVLNTKLHITIAISGWLSDEEPDNFKRPWKNLLNSTEQYYLRYESQYLLELGNAMKSIVNFTVSVAAQEALKYTVLNGIITAIAWPASLVSLASVIDNPWGVCCNRSAQVGKLLAEVLLSREQGQRPVTLIGFSLGARIIFYCLEEMARRDDCEGIIEDAILLGTPVTGLVKDWNKLTRVVAGRLINGYSKNDWLLTFLYRVFSMASGVAGLQPIESTNKKIINFDLTDIVSGHTGYAENMGYILKLMKIGTIDGNYKDLGMKKSISDLPHISKKQMVSMSSLRSSLSEESPI